MRSWGAALVLVGTLGLGVAEAQVYHWVDDRGVIHYSTGIESVPERYRPEARPLPVSPGSPEPAERRPSAQPAAATSISFTPGSPILVSARINGAGPVTLILDTGASRTLVTPAALWRLGIPTPNTYRAEIKGVTGMSRADVVWVNSLEVGNAVVGPLPIIAHDADLAQADGLLGRDFLQLFSVAIDAKVGVVTIGSD